MKIAIISQGDKASGAEIITEGLYHCFRKNTVVLSGSSPIVDFFTNKGYHVEPIKGLVPLNRSSLKLNTVIKVVFSLFLIRKYIVREKPSYIHVYNLASLLYTVLALIGLRKKYILVLHVHDYYSKDSFLRVISKLIKNKPDYIIAVSNDIKNDLMGLGFSPEKLQCIHNGIEVFLPAQYNIELEEKSKFTIGFVGNLSKWKGVHILLQAAKLLENSGHYFYYAIIGAFDNTDYENEIKNLIQSLNLKNIKLLGKKNNARDYIRNFDVLVHCSIQPDPFPTVLLEAMHLGCPVIGPSAGGVPEIIDNDQTGLLFKIGSAQSLADGLLKYSSNDTFRNMIAKQAWKKAKEEYSIEKFRSAFFSNIGISLDENRDAGK